jgi:hypothetical protein
MMKGTMKQRIAKLAILVSPLAVVIATAAPRLGFG